MNVTIEKTIGQTVGLRINEQFNPFRSFVANRIVGSVYWGVVNAVQPEVSGNIRLGLGFVVWQLCKEDLHEMYKGFNLLLFRSR